MVTYIAVPNFAILKCDSKLHSFYHLREVEFAVQAAHLSRLWYQEQDLFQYSLQYDDVLKFAKNCFVVLLNDLIKYFE